MFVIIISGIPIIIANGIKITFNIKPNKKHGIATEATIQNDLQLVLYLLVSK